MLNIVFNIDKNYINIAKTVIKSILLNTKAKVRFHVLGVDELECKADIKCYGKPDVSGFNFKPVRHLTEAIMYRLFIPEIIKADEVVYLDCDTIVLGDIKELFEYDVEYIAGVQDPLYIRQARKNNLRHCYINSGVMVMNLRALRGINYMERLKATQNRGYNLSLFDQDVINIAFGDLIQHLPECWNVYSKIYSQTTSDMLKARENPKIIHWCGENKPWNSEVWMSEIWHKYNML